MGLLFATCSTGGKPALFERVDEEYSGLHFNNLITAGDSLNALNFPNIYHGAGVGIGDFNGDGLPDVFMAGNMVSSRLYLNQGSFRFTDITSPAKVETTKWVNGVSVVDINQDGRKDIYLSCIGANILFINKGPDASGIPVFEDQAAAYGLNNTAYSMQAAFFDYDLDGDLDMYLLNNGLASAKTNYLVRPRLLKGESETTDRLYRSDGDKTQPCFTDVTIAAGLGAEGFGLGVAVSDLNHDGYPDLYISNDYISNDLLLINNRNGTFSDRNNQWITQTSLNGMGVDIADVNNDGWTDIVQLDMLPLENQRRKMMLGKPNYALFSSQRKLNYQAQFVKNSLQLNKGVGPDGELFFSECAEMAGIAATDWSWAPLLADFDNDGFRDLYISNGYRRNITDLDFIVNDFKSNNKFGTAAFRKSTYKVQLEQLPEIKIRDNIFRNNAGEFFEDKTNGWGFDSTSFSTGAAYADLDNDGDLDLVVNAIDAPAIVYRNTLNNNAAGEEKSHFLSVHLEGDSLNKQGIGAVLTVFIADKKIRQEQYPVRGYLSSVDEKLVIGIGNHRMVDSCRIRWPDGRTELRSLLAADSVYTFRYDQSTLPAIEADVIRVPLFTDITANTGVIYQHQEADFSDFDINSLIPYKTSQNGPCYAVGDIDGDSLEDVFIGGNTVSSAHILFQQPDGKFRMTDLGEAGSHEDLAALLFDADNDHDLDLYIVRGSTEFGKGAVALQDSFFLNDGSGHLEPANNRIPAETSNGGTVAAADYDGDGDLDLFVGGKSTPGAYPLADSSMLLENQSGYFRRAVASGLPSHMGIINAAGWADLDGDGDADLVTAAEFGQVTVHLNQRGHFTLPTGNGLAAITGWWKSLGIADIDNDGDIDIIAGNLGLNSHFRASSDKPLTLYEADLDGNGNTESVIGFYLPDQDGRYRLYPDVPRDQLIAQVPLIRKRYERYSGYADATLDDIFDGYRGTVEKLAITDLRSLIFINDGKGNFRMTPLPVAAQSAPIFKVLTTDINKDGFIDLMVGGNDRSWEVRYGFTTGMNGMVLLGDGKGNFQSLSERESGLFERGDMRAIAMVQGSGKRRYFIVGINRGCLKVFE
ncbi:VCBS repeat-containing protein [Flavihumibacter petaseus]|uniref:ASPIC/UnbV domain-containing protein n=1 Tax=Flavihumibacter petaseus NBRC 106054 TaxID=1220578 RepID=A0A0E9MVS9_9BACT|nr:VCBS repeat-containing protein [Flavihumibacter petaseus]GAO41516.1 hypothetical protein FPE01S_01_05300 [Flavihumibacter petaseus NBRC 106054]